MHERAGSQDLLVLMGCWSYLSETELLHLSGGDRMDSAEGKGDMDRIVEW
jgi:hypothetical protein